MRERSVGAWRGARGCVCEFAIKTIAGCARFTGADGRSMPTNGAQTHRRHRLIRLINTNISLHSVPRLGGSANCGYSVSVFQFVGLTAPSAGHHRHLACDLRAGQRGGIDLPARLCMACGLNSRQINHLQRVASETHYRGQSSDPTSAGAIGYR